VIQIGALWTRTRKFLILLGERHHETARSQAPAWERTAFEALPRVPSSSSRTIPCFGRQSLQFSGFQGRALEPDGGDQREVSKFFQKRLSPMETEIRIVLGGSTNFEFLAHGIGLARY